MLKAPGSCDLDPLPDEIEDELVNALLPLWLNELPDKPHHILFKSCGTILGEMLLQLGGSAPPQTNDNEHPVFGLLRGLYANEDCFDNIESSLQEFNNKTFPKIILNDTKLSLEEKLKNLKALILNANINVYVFTHVIQTQEPDPLREISIIMALGHVLSKTYSLILDTELKTINANDYQLLVSLIAPYKIQLTKLHTSFKKIIESISDNTPHPEELKIQLLDVFKTFITNDIRHAQFLSFQGNHQAAILLLTQAKEKYQFLRNQLLRLKIDLSEIDRNNNTYTMDDLDQSVQSLSRLYTLASEDFKAIDKVLIGFKEGNSRLQFKTKEQFLAKIEAQLIMARSIVKTGASTATILRAVKETLEIVNHYFSLDQDNRKEYAPKMSECLMAWVLCFTKKDPDDIIKSIRDKFRELANRCLRESQSFSPDLAQTKPKTKVSEVTKAPDAHRLCSLLEKFTESTKPGEENKEALVLLSRNPEFTNHEVIKESVIPYFLACGEINTYQAGELRRLPLTEQKKFINEKLKRINSAYFIYKHVISAAQYPFNKCTSLIYALHSDSYQLLDILTYLYLEANLPLGDVGLFKNLITTYGSMARELSKERSDFILNAIRSLDGQNDIDQFDDYKSTIWNLAALGTSVRGQLVDFYQYHAMKSEQQAETLLFNESVSLLKKILPDLADSLCSDRETLESNIRELEEEAQTMGQISVQSGSPHQQLLRSWQIVEEFLIIETDPKKFLSVFHFTSHIDAKTFETSLTFLIQEIENLTDDKPLSEWLTSDALTYLQAACLILFRLKADDNVNAQYKSLYSKAFELCGAFSRFYKAEKNEPLQSLIIERFNTLGSYYQNLVHKLTVPTSKRETQQSIEVINPELTKEMAKQIVLMAMTPPLNLNAAQVQRNMSKFEDLFRDSKFMQVLNMTITGAQVELGSIDNIKIIVSKKNSKEDKELLKLKVKKRISLFYYSWCYIFAPYHANKTLNNFMLSQLFDELTNAMFHCFDALETQSLEKEDLDFLAEVLTLSKTLFDKIERTFIDLLDKIVTNETKDELMPYTISRLKAQMWLSYSLFVGIPLSYGEFLLEQNNLSEAKQQIQKAQSKLSNLKEKKDAILSACGQDKDQATNEIKTMERRIDDLKKDYEAKLKASLEQAKEKVAPKQESGSGRAIRVVRQESKEYQEPKGKGKIVGEKEPEKIGKRKKNKTQKQVVLSIPSDPQQTNLTTRLPTKVESKPIQARAQQIPQPPKTQPQALPSSVKKPTAFFQKRAATPKLLKSKPAPVPMPQVIVPAQVKPVIVIPPMVGNAWFKDKEITEKAPLPVVACNTVVLENDPLREPLPIITPQAIALPPDVKSLMDFLVANKVWVCAAGGCARDFLRKVKPNDWDLVTNCPVDKLRMLLQVYMQGKKCIEIKLNKQISLFEMGDGIDIVCTHPEKPSLRALLQEYDVTVNTYCFDRHGNLLAPLDNYADWDNPYLKGILNETTVLRWVRFKNELSKEFPEEIIQELPSLDSVLPKLIWSLFKKQLEKLFLNGMAVENLQTLLSLNILPSLLFPQLKREIKYLQQIIDCWLDNCEILDQSYRQAKQNGESLKKSTDIFEKILSLLLLPYVEASLEKNKTNAITEVLNLFCLHHPGFEEADKNLIRKAAPGFLEMTLDSYNKLQALPESTVAPVYVPKFLQIGLPSYGVAEPRTTQSSYASKERATP